MKKIVPLLIITIFICFGSLSVFGDEIFVKSKGKHEWEVYNQSGDSIGALKKTEEGNFIFFDEQGNYSGLILKSGQWKPKGLKPKITPRAAKLYLDVLEAIELIK